MSIIGGVLVLAPTDFSTGLVVDDKPFTEWRCQADGDNVAACGTAAQTAVGGRSDTYLCVSFCDFSLNSAVTTTASDFKNCGAGICSD